VVLVNSSRPPDAFSDLGDYRIATLDALVVAQKNDLGRIVNSALLGAFARVMGSPEIEHLARVVKEVSPRKGDENAQAVLDGFATVQVLGWGTPGHPARAGAAGDIREGAPA
jgi:pyruvate ferredoxin oxidoreductase gamma subunit